MRLAIRCFYSLFLCLSLVTSAAAQRTVARDQEQTLVTLEALRESIASKQQDLEERQRALEAATMTSDQRIQLLEEIRRHDLTLAALRADFESVATGLDFEEFETARRKGIDLKAEVEKLLAPIIEELKSATEAPRQTEDLRTSLAYYQERKALARTAIAQLERLLAAGPEQPLAERLRATLESWRQRLRDIENQETVARFQLETRIANQRSVLESTRSVLSNFFRTRGLNLLLAIGSLIAVFLGLRWLYGLIRRISPIHRRAERPFYVRLVDVLVHGFTGMASLLAALLVLYASGDWVLLGLMLLFLLGVAWASKSTVPQFLDQIRLLLNFGTVRERERVIYRGLPWRVSRLSLATILSNPDLAGGVLRLPVRDLLEMRSRPCSKDDVWFPSRRHDWVRISGDRLAQVLHQSVDVVTVRFVGGSMMTFPTLDYLALAPENLSQGFRLAVTFGIDYAHQAISTRRVPEIMRARLEKGLLELVEPEELLKLSVEFQDAGASSLDYRVNADFAGELAPRSEVLRRAIKRILVDVCNDEGWVIPFTQVTIHQAAAES